jgi:protein-arginine kinase activator protein McsA
MTKEEILIDLEEIQKKKANAIKNQQYEYAAKLRDDERICRNLLKNHPDNTSQNDI